MPSRHRRSPVRILDMFSFIFQTYIIAEVSSTSLVLYKNLLNMYGSLQYISRPLQELLLLVLMHEPSGHLLLQSLVRLICLLVLQSNKLPCPSYRQKLSLRLYQPSTLDVCRPRKDSNTIYKHGTLFYSSLTNSHQVLYILALSTFITRRSSRFYSTILTTYKKFSTICSSLFPRTLLLLRTQDIPSHLLHTTPSGL